MLFEDVSLKGLSVKMETDFIIQASAGGPAEGEVEVSLRERERELEEAHRIARLGTWKWVKATNVLTWSPEVYRIYGCDPALPPPRGEATRRLMTEKAWADITSALQRAFDFGEPYEIDLEVLHPSGEPRWVQARGEVGERGADGAVTVLRGTVQDITERKLAEARLRHMTESLRETQSQFERLYDANLMGICYPDRHGAFFEGNEEFLRIVGYTRAELRAGLVRWDTMTPPEYADLDARHIAEAAKRGSCTPYEKEYIRKDGTRVPIVCGYALLEGSEDEYIGFISDLTAQKEAERAITSQERRFRELAESLPELLWESNAEGAVTYFNHNFRIFTGMDLEDVRGREIIELVHPEDEARTFAKWHACVQSGEPYENELRMRRHDGVYRTFLARAVGARNEQGEIVRWLGTATDIHDQKLAEEVVRRTEKLAAMGRLAASMAHEINNPLESVTNSLYLALQDAGLSPVTRTFLEMADKELRRVAHVTTQTLRFHRQSKLPAKEDLGALMDSAIALFEGRTGAMGVTVERDYRTTERLFCCGDEIRQVFANLASNALDASRTGGRIRARISKVRAWDEARTEGLRVSVGDTGHGIPVEVRGKIFEAFMTTKDATGTGLGLWVSAGIVQKHGGKIAMRSRVGRGTVFSVFLPVAGPAGGVSGSVARGG
jgi:PAS domain S-box-containing protein